MHVPATFGMKNSLECTVFLIWFLTIFARINSDSVGCKFQIGSESTAYKKLKGLVNHTFKVHDDKYEYNIGICTDALKGNFQNQNVGVAQTDTEDSKKDPTIIGKFDHSSIMGGTNWVMLEYTSGDNSDKSCGQEPKKAVILFTCDPAADFSSPGMRMIEKEKGKETGCYYLFEMSHASVCDVQVTKGSSLSIGSIILIVFFCVAAVYLIAGGVYQRFIMGAKGTEQIPNYDFWKDFGNLQADGCDFVCRTRDARHSSPYKGLGDDQLEEPEERDDNLLPM